jgi:hypothetical protein
MVMKQKIYIVGLVTAALVFLGTIFKINHLPGAGILLTLGIGSFVLVFLPSALINLGKSEKSGRSKTLYIVTYITCLLVFTAMLFKIQHWPYAGLLLTIALPFPYIVFLPVFLRITSREENFNIYNTVAVLILLVVNSVFSGLLAINVSKNKIIESYNISHNYEKQENLLLSIPVITTGSAIDTKINEIIKLAEEYQAILLKSEGKTINDWHQHPEDLRRPDAAGLCLYLLTEAGEKENQLRLEEELKELSVMLKQEKNCSEIAAIAPALFDLQTTDGEDDWGIRTFSDNNLAWSLMYLDGLKADLLMIKAVI